MEWDSGFLDVPWLFEHLAPPRALSIENNNMFSYGYDPSTIHLLMHFSPLNMRLAKMTPQIGQTYPRIICDASDDIFFNPPVHLDFFNQNPSNLISIVASASKPFKKAHR